MAESRARILAGILDNTGDIKSTSLDNVSTGLTVYATIDDLPTSGLTSGQQAFVTSANRVYVSNGSGWYSVALFNATPRLTISPSGAVTLAVDGSTPTVITLTGTDSDNADANLVYSVESDGSFSNIATLSQDSSVFTITPLAEDSATPGSSTLTFKVSDGISFGSGTTQFSLTFAPDWSATPTESILHASDLANSKQLGYTSGISDDGTYAVSGAIYGGHTVGPNQQGTAYVWVRSGSTWSQQAKLESSTGAYYDQFGRSIDMSGDGNYIVVGAQSDDNNGLSSSGSVYVFVRSGSSWSQQQLIAPSDKTASKSFGSSVSINTDGTYIAVGAYGDGGGNNQGAAYVFTRSGTTWTQQQKIAGTDTTTNDRFGGGIGINSDATYIGVTASGEGTGGSAYIFTRSGSTWTQQQKLVPSNTGSSDQLGGTSSGNGGLVDLSDDGTYFIAGAPYEDGATNSTSSSGAVYIWKRTGSSWSEEAILRASDVASSQYFGNSAKISADGNYAVCGAWGDTGQNGAAYVFERSGSTWTQVKKLTSSDQGGNDQYGFSTDISDDGKYVIVGAREEDGGSGNPQTGAGAAYIYEAD
jgi:hypothetical protein